MGDAMNEREHALELLAVAIDGAQETGLHLEEFIAASIEVWGLVNSEWIASR